MLSNTKKKMDNLKTRNRNLTADFLKAVMIFCVLYGHSVSMINGLRDVTWQDSVVNVFVTTVEMPLFILISGYYLFFSLKKKPHFKVLCQRIVSIAIPLIIWEGIPAVYKFIIKPMGDGFSFINIIKVVYNLIFPELWFLACYLICCILVILVDWLISKISKRALAITAGALIYFGIIVGLHLINHSLNHVPYMFPFFLTGFVLSKYSLLKKSRMKKILWIFAILFVVLYPFYKPENSFYILGTYVAKENVFTLLPVFVHRFVLGLSGCSLFYLIANFFCEKQNNKIVLTIVKFGSKTMEMYILSMFVQKILQSIFRELISDVSVITNITAPLVFGPVFLIIMTAVCLLVNWLIEKIPVLHKLMFGR